MKRGGRLRRVTPLRSVSEKRRRDQRVRSDVRQVVLARDRRCVAEGIPGIPHGHLPGRQPLEVHELARGAGRNTAWLDASWCIALCPVAHDWVTAHPRDAQLKGLAVPSHSSGVRVKEAGALRDAWRTFGHAPMPTWFQDPHVEHG